MILYLAANQLNTASQGESSSSKNMQGLSQCSHLPRVMVCGWYRKYLAIDPFFQGHPIFRFCLLGHHGAYHRLFVPKSVHLWSFPGHPIRLKRLDEQILEAKKEMFLFAVRGWGQVQYLLWVESLNGICCFLLASFSALWYYIIILCIMYHVYVQYDFSGDYGHGFGTCWMVIRYEKHVFWDRK